MIIRNVATFQNRWRNSNIAVGVGMVLIAIAISWIVYYACPELSMAWSIVTFLTTAAIATLTFRSLPAKNVVKTHLHENISALEYSLDLTYKSEQELTGLQLLQQSKINKLLSKEKAKIPLPKRLISSSLIIVVLMAIILAAAGLTDLNKSENSVVEQDFMDIQQGNIDLKKDSAYLKTIAMLISPPEYTVSKKFTSSEMSLTVPEGSRVSWNYDPSPAVKKVIFHHDEEEPTTKQNKVFMDSGIYYYAVSDSSGKQYNSDYFSIKVKEDELPQVSINGIPEYQKLDWKPNYDLTFKIAIQDDYGIEDAFISATVATGEGESVKFREKTFPLKNTIQTEHTFSTKDFEMEPGSELYFYVMAKDNCPFRTQATKSKTYFVVLKDTTTYAYTDDAGMQVDLMPDFFRSQRQIIIDSEQLLMDKSQISEQEFKQRSNELGYDQKLLRLKYGQFLGEEAESGIALENEIETEEHDHDHDHEHDHEEVNVLEEYGHNHDHEAEEGMLLEENGTRQEEDPSRPDWVKELSHSHDNGEVNTYFEVSLKGKLRAALSVMWDAELHLRLYNPAESLPYQYEALEYLQEIKNHARIYVHRIGFDPPAIKVAEKRLSGEMDEVVSASTKVEGGYEDAFASIRTGADLLSGKNCKMGCQIIEKERLTLEKAGSSIAMLAIENPSLLASLGALREALNSSKITSETQRQGILLMLLDALPEEAIVREKDALVHPVIQAILEAE